MPLLSLCQHNPTSISLSLRCLKSVFPVFSPQKSSFQIVTCATLPTLRPSLPAKHPAIDSLDGNAVENASSVGNLAHQKCQMVLSRSIDHCLFPWPCCWARCWMLQDMDHMEASGIYYVKVGRFDQLERSKISIVTITSFRIVIRRVYHRQMVSVWFRYDPGNV